MASLIIVAGPAEGSYYPLGKRTVVIGRDEAVPVQILDEEISRKHCQIRWDETGKSYHVFDMKSANGTFVAGRRIYDDLALADGDVLEIGKSRVMFTVEDFPDRQSAFDYYKQRGERGKSTLAH
ncbi:MAG: FHA domain-containing protein [Phycisphaerales bacterium]|nr:MAG: FHA domain-containing protein [Phycisphaerales bacterium]